MAEATGTTTPLRVHVPEHASRRVTMYPRQVAARPPHYSPPLPSRRQPEAPAPSRNPQNGRGTTDKQGSRGDSPLLNAAAPSSQASTASLSLRHHF